MIEQVINSRNFSTGHYPRQSNLKDNDYFMNATQTSKRSGSNLLTNKTKLDNSSTLEYGGVMKNSYQTDSAPRLHNIKAN